MGRLCYWGRREKKRVQNISHKCPGKHPFGRSRRRRDVDGTGSGSCPVASCDLL